MANHIEIRQVEIREGNATDGYRTVGYKFQYRTKDIVSAVLGLIPLTANWTDWTDMQVVVVLQDSNGNPSP